MIRRLGDEVLMPSFGGEVLAMRSGDVRLEDLGLRMRN